MLTSRERAYLRSQAAAADTILTIGKGGVTSNVTAEAENALRARELVKGGVLDTSPLTPREVCEKLAAACAAETVQVVGSKFVLYRANKDLPAGRRIDLGKA